MAKKKLKVQFKEWDIYNCQYSIDKYKKDTSTMDDKEIWKNRISEYETQKQIYMTDLQALQKELSSKRAEYNLDREVLYELTSQRQQLEDKIKKLQSMQVFF